MLALAKIGTEYYLFGAAGLISLLAFAALILIPAIGSYGRSWEKATAALLSLFVLAALVLLGVALGVLIVYFWPDITRIVPGLD
jgi:hypothetical protein